VIMMSYYSRDTSCASSHNCLVLDSSCFVAALGVHTELCGTREQVLTLYTPRKGESVVPLTVAVKRARARSELI